MSEMDVTKDATAMMTDTSMTQNLISLKKDWEKTSFQGCLASA